MTIHARHVGSQEKHVLVVSLITFTSSFMIVFVSRHAHRASMEIQNSNAHHVAKSANNVPSLANFVQSAQTQINFCMVLQENVLMLVLMDNSRMKKLYNASAVVPNAQLAQALPNV